MSTRLKMVLWLLMNAGFAFGFAGLVLAAPASQAEILPRAFQRLHIFLFNLVSGGVILVYFLDGQPRLSRRGQAYLAGALAFSAAAFLNQYWLASLLVLALAGIVELARRTQFPFFPTDFFASAAPASGKFRHAAVLCLELGLLISAGVMVNDQYLHLVNLPELTLEKFFLGFSFPLSLIIFSMVFSPVAPADPDWRMPTLGRVSFWTLTLGVITFFVFIIFKMGAAELVIATLLLLNCCLILYVFKTTSARRVASGGQLGQTQLLTSGLFFLVATGLTGLALIVWRLYYPDDKVSLVWQFLLRLHAYLSLYGWNLSGLIVIVRRSDLPLQTSSRKFIWLHWATIAILAPVGMLNSVFAAAAVLALAGLTALAFFGRGQLPPAGQAAGASAQKE